MAQKATRPRLHALRARVKEVGDRVQAAGTRSEKRMTGRRLQQRRLRVWSQDPHCVDCGRVTAWPAGFELDHVVPLAEGGEDSDENSSVRCLPCHWSKTQRDLARIRSAR